MSAVTKRRSSRAVICAQPDCLVGRSLKVRNAGQSGIDCVRKRLIITVAAITVSAVSALADQQRLRKDVRFCPSWAEAHERTLASLNNGRPPYPVRWKGCIWLKQGTKVDVIDHDESRTEILVNGKHWFADE